VGFQFMLILGLQVMYFDAAVVFVTKSSLLFKLAVNQAQFHSNKTGLAVLIS